MSERANATVVRGREIVRRILSQGDPRLLVIVGPCSIHDTAGALEYAGRLSRLRAELEDQLCILMRVYFEKPRTTIGWKGLINDPHLDGSYDIETGLRTARSLLLQITELGLPTATEFLDPIVPQYLADLVSWAAIGARTTESQTHREMASGLSMPVGFKNGTDGSLQIAIDAMGAARQPHSFLGIDQDGVTSIIRTTGNRVAATDASKRDSSDSVQKDAQRHLTLPPSARSRLPSSPAAPAATRWHASDRVARRGCSAVPGQANRQNGTAPPGVGISNGVTANDPVQNLPLGVQSPDA